MLLESTRLENAGFSIKICLVPWGMGAEFGKRLQEVACYKTEGLDMEESWESEDLKAVYLL